MGNGNFKQAQKWATYYGVNCQLIEGACVKNRNCKAVVYNGTVIKTSTMVGEDLKLLFEQLACGQNVEACSVAKQMINKAHGRTNAERTQYFVNQSMTYADPYENVQFKGRTLTSVLNQLIDRDLYCVAFGYDLNCVENWAKSMKEWHGANTLNKIKEMINSKAVRIYDNHVISNYIFMKFIDKWTSENGKDKISDEHKMMIIDRYFDELERV